MFAWLHADIHPVEQTESLIKEKLAPCQRTVSRRHIQISWYCLMLSQDRISCQSEVMSQMFPYLLLTDSLIFRLPQLGLCQRRLHNLALIHHQRRGRRNRDTSGSAFVHSLFFSRRQRQGGVMDLSKGSCHRAAFRSETFALSRSWQRYPWSQIGLKIVCNSKDTITLNAVLFLLTSESSAALLNGSKATT